MADTATPKRTRRVNAPFDDRLLIRLYSTEKARLNKEAKDRGMSVADLVRSQLGDLMAADPPGTPDPTAPPIDLAEAIAAQTGVSYGQALLKIKLGKVTVDGKPYAKTEIRPELLEHVSVAGELLSTE